MADFSLKFSLCSGWFHCGFGCRLTPFNGSNPHPVYPTGNLHVNHINDWHVTFFFFFTRQRLTNPFRNNVCHCLYNAMGCGFKWNRHRFLHRIYAEIHFLIWTGPNAVLLGSLGFLIMQSGTEESLYSQPWESRKPQGCLYTQPASKAHLPAACVIRSQHNVFAYKSLPAWRL